MDILLKNTKQHYTLKIHTILFMVLFFCSILLANLSCSDEAFWLGFQIENNLRQFRTAELSPDSFCIYLVKNRLVIWIILCFFGYFQRGNLFYLIYTGWLGFSSGFFITTLIQHLGLMSLLMIPGICLPQLPIYVFLYILLIRNKVKGTRAYIPKCLLLSVIFLGGVFCEYYVNPWILQKIYHFVTLVS